jgi:hypothetical protein
LFVEINKTCSVTKLVEQSLVVLLYDSTNANAEILLGKDQIAAQTFLVTLPGMTVGFVNRIKVRRSGNDYSAANAASKCLDISIEANDVVNNGEKRVGPHEDKGARLGGIDGKNGSGRIMINRGHVRQNVWMIY